MKTSGLKPAATILNVPPTDRVIILFDGQCNFCNRGINFLMDRDAADRFRFASQQSDIGQSLLLKHDEVAGVDSVVVIDPQTQSAFTKSAAIIRILRDMPARWRWLRFFGAVLPAVVRDPLYDLIAKNRYRIFGKSDACRMPTPDIAAKFL